MAIQVVSCQGINYNHSMRGLKNLLITKVSIYQPRIITVIKTSQVLSGENISPGTDIPSENS